MLPWSVRKGECQEPKQPKLPSDSTTSVGSEWWLMTKARVDFADENRDMARRALWLLRGNAPVRELPADLPLNELWTFTGEDRILVPLAAFGVQRHEDAQRDAPGKFPDEIHQSYADALIAERRVDETVREAVTALRKAETLWARAIQLRAVADESLKFVASDPRILPIGAGLPRIVDALEIVSSAIGAYRRQLGASVVGPKFASLCGLPQSERRLALDAQGLRLVEAGVSRDAVAFVLGWDYGSAEFVADRVRKRLEEARQREAGLAVSESPAEE